MQAIMLCRSVVTEKSTPKFHQWLSKKIFCHKCFRNTCVCIVQILKTGQDIDSLDALWSLIFNNIFVTLATSMGKSCQTGQNCRRDAPGSKSHLYSPLKSTLVKTRWPWLETQCQCNFAWKIWGDGKEKQSSSCWKFLSKYIYIILCQNSLSLLVIVISHLYQ